jgi:hypothetical protein
LAVRAPLQFVQLGGLERVPEVRAAAGVEGLDEAGIRGMKLARVRVALALSGSCPGMSPGDGDDAWCKLIGAERHGLEVE